MAVPSDMGIIPKAEVTGSNAVGCANVLINKTPAHRGEKMARLAMQFDGLVVAPRQWRAPSPPQLRRDQESQARVLVGWKTV